MSIVFRTATAHDLDRVLSVLDLQFVSGKGRSLVAGAAFPRGFLRGKRAQYLSVRGKR